MSVLPITDITAIYNVFAFWAYLLAIRMLGEKPTTWKLASVLVAVTGVFIIAYGDSFLLPSTSPIETPSLVPSPDASSRLLGNLLALFGSISYAWYEVWYKLNVALPDFPTDQVEQENVEEEEEANALLSQEENNDEESTSTYPSHPPPASLLSITSVDPSVLHPSASTYLLYSNFITTSIGFGTLLMLWIPIPVLHWLELEVFELPPKGALLAISFMILSGVAFNASFMLLLSIWGPVIAVSITFLPLLSPNANSLKSTHFFFFSRSEIYVL